MKNEIKLAKEQLEQEAYDWADDENNNFTWENYKKIKNAPDEDFIVEDGTIYHRLLNEPLSVEII